MGSASGLRGRVRDDRASAKLSIYFAATRLIMHKTTTSLQGGLAIAGSATRRPRGLPAEL